MTTRKKTELKVADTDITDITERASRYLARIRDALDEVEDIDTALELTKKTKALQTYCRSARDSLKMLQEISELNLRAQLAAGRILSEMSLHGGDRKSESRSETPTLTELGIKKDQSSLWQKMSKLDPAEVERYFARQRQEGLEITQAGLVRIRSRREDMPRDTPHLKCPRCGMRYNRARHTGRVVAMVLPRNRTCLTCNYVFKTWEFVIDPDNPPVVPIFHVPLSTPVDEDSEDDGDSM